jgi:hypothetical protein
MVSSPDLAVFLIRVDSRLFKLHLRCAEEAKDSIRRFLSRIRMLIFEQDWNWTRTLKDLGGNLVLHLICKNDVRAVVSLGDSSPAFD